MGRRKVKKEVFLKNHPVCCFCGGDQLATEEDHIPSRAIFDHRQWPEGYVFPACSSCNRRSRHSENIVNLLSRLHPGEESDVVQKDTDRAIQAVDYNYPGLLQEMLPSTRDARNAVKKYQLQKPAGIAYKDLPLLTLESGRVDGAIKEFGLKLFLALYYKHTSQILPPQGGVAIRWYTNLQLIDGAIPSDVIDRFGGYPEIVRCNTSLKEQFSYKYGVTPNNEAAGFIAVLRKSFAVVGFVYVDSEKLNVPAGEELLRPYIPIKD